MKPRRLTIALAALAAAVAAAAAPAARADQAPSTNAGTVIVAAGTSGDVVRSCRSPNAASPCR